MVKAKLYRQNHTKKHTHKHSQKEKKEKYTHTHKGYSVVYRTEGNVQHPDLSKDKNYDSSKTAGTKIHTPAFCS